MRAVGKAHGCAAEVARGGEVEGSGQGPDRAHHRKYLAERIGASDRVGGERSAERRRTAHKCVAGAGRRDLDQVVGEVLEHEIASDDETPTALSPGASVPPALIVVDATLPVTVPVPPSVAPEFTVTPLDPAIEPETRNVPAATVVGPL